MSFGADLNVVEELHWYTQVIDTMDVGLFVLDLDFKVVAWNRFMQSYSGIPSARSLIRTYSLFVAACLKHGWKLSFVPACHSKRKGFLRGKIGRVFSSLRTTHQHRVACFRCIKIW